MRTLAVLFFSCATLLWAPPTQAQTPIQEQGAFIVVSQYPYAPGEFVELSLRSVSLPLQALSIVWYVDEKEVVRETGKTYFSFRLKDAGIVSTVRARVFSEEGIVLAEPSVALTPALVDIIWEARTYTHPFFGGKPLPSEGSAFVAQARPVFLEQNGQLVEPKDIDFTWSVDGQVLGALSGRGRDVVSLDAPAQGGEYVLEVRATSADTRWIASKKTRVPSVPPQLTLYKVDPLLGVDLRESSATLTIADTEGTFTLFPYYAPIMSLKDPSFSVRWWLNDVPTEGKGNNITLVPPAQGVRTRLSARVLISFNELLDIRRGWSVLFPDESSLLDIFDGGQEQRI